MSLSASGTAADVVVIGAGIVGIAAACHLAEEGRSVLLLDRDEPAMGASFGNAGAFAFSDVMPLASPGIIRKAPKWLLDPLGPLAIPPAYLPRIAPWLLRFWRASRPDRVKGSMVAQAAMMRLAREAMGALVARAGLSGMVRSDGALELHESEAQWRASLPGWEARAKEGIVFEHLRGEAIAALQPGLSPQFRFATFVPGWQTVEDPHLFARGLLAHAEARGAIFRRARVLAVSPTAEGARIAIDGGESIEAGRAVIACGAWSRPLAAALGDRVPLETQRGYHVMLPDAGVKVGRVLSPADRKVFITPMEEGLRVAGSVEIAGLDAPPNEARAQLLLGDLRAVFPEVRTDGATSWMGHRPCLPDSVPVMGPLKTWDGIWCAFGHGHLGLTGSAPTGAVVAAAIAGEKPNFDFAPFSAERFA